ncbi:MAG TPA: hypothetical protein VHZ26_08400 [Caulobacteraceae bacterium]|jgi:hypothetical protein|nr:hypothetical protein [Caulobacteraceae bacterium]
MAGDAVRLNSGGAVMTAERVNHQAEHPVARCVGLDALALAGPEQHTRTDCPETRMAGGNNNNNNNKRR